MKIKIATWNMGYWQYKKHFEEAWGYYLKEINADIIFFQEARLSKRIQNNKEHLVWNEIGCNRPWGSGYSIKLISCEVVDNDKVRKYSDHNPVVITLDF